MAKWGRRLFSIAFSFMFLFITVGYAQIADIMTITGTGEYAPALDKVIFTYAEPYILNGGTSESVNCYYPTNIGSTIKYDGTSEVMDITYKVTAKNYSDSVKYAYIGIACDEQMDNDNSLYASGDLAVDAHIHQGTTETELTPGAAIEPGQEITLYISYDISKDKIPDDGIVTTMLNFKFGYHTDSAGEAATQEIFRQFTDILNDPAKIAQIDSQLDKSETLGDSNRFLENRDYIGNVASSLIGGFMTGEEQDLIEGLFGDTLKINTVNANGATETHNVQVIIQRKDIYGSSEEELILYMTTVDIYSMSISQSNRYIDNIYATAFVNDANVGWIQVGDMYTGRAIAGRINTAGGSPSYILRADSFNPDTWISMEDTYTVTNEYSYTLEAGKNISAVINDPVKNEAWNLLNELYTTAEQIDVDKYAASTEIKDALVNARINIKAMIDAGSTNAKQAFVVSAIAQLKSAMSPFGY